MKVEQNKMINQMTNMELCHPVIGEWCPTCSNSPRGEYSPTNHDGDVEACFTSSVRCSPIEEILEIVSSYFRNNDVYSRAGEMAYPSWCDKYEYDGAPLYPLPSRRWIRLGNTVILFRCYHRLNLVPHDRWGVKWEFCDDDLKHYCYIYDYILRYSQYCHGERHDIPNYPLAIGIKKHPVDLSCWSLDSCRFVSRNIRNAVAKEVFLTIVVIAALIYKANGSAVYSTNIGKIKEFRLILKGIYTLM